MKITANDIHKGLMAFVRGSSSDMIIPNYYVHNWEMDVFKMSGSGYITEYEIKVSRSDFKADFKKGKTHRNNSTVKHELLKSGNSPANRFFFVVPFQMVTPDDIPSYCGLIYYRKEIREWGERNVYSIVKNAPLLHKNKFHFNWKSCAMNLQNRLTQNRIDKRDHRHAIDSLYKTINELKKERFDLTKII